MYITPSLMQGIGLSLYLISNRILGSVLIATLNELLEANPLGMISSGLLADIGIKLCYIFRNLTQEKAESAIHLRI
jgi:F0F1-type ATP synthase assembly protein I